MQTYHLAWLSAHPERTPEWLKDRLADGFHVHHIDGNHYNDDPQNLVLIEGGDHLMLHNGATRLLWRPQDSRPPKQKKPKTIKKTLRQLRQELALTTAELMYSTNETTQ